MNRIACVVMCCVCLMAGRLVAASAERALADYRLELERCRQAHGGVRELPDVKFFLFGMGHRAKLLYRDGVLREALTGRELRHWAVKNEWIVPPDYRVVLETDDGSSVSICEDGAAVWIEEKGQRTAVDGTRSALVLPAFEGKSYPRVLRVLHQEILVNVTGDGPLPNYFVYRKPWYRDGAMMALALKETGNISVLRDWILGLKEPFDRNNGGMEEPDNLGQALFLVSLVSDKNHPLVNRVLDARGRFEVRENGGVFIKGKSDFAVHPVYQTKWLKFGLRALGLADPYTIPAVADSYSALFWMGYRDRHVAGCDANERKNYPYLGWACDHFYGTKTSPLSNRDYPLSWESRASQADYRELGRIDPLYVESKLSAPHTWHAAEMFLSLLDEQVSLGAKEEKLGK